MTHRPLRQLARYLLFVTLLLSTAIAQADGFARFDGIDGDAAEKDHRNWISLLGVSYAMQRPAASSTGASRRRGTATFEPIRLIKRVDKASPKLQEALATGRVIKTVTLDVTGGSRGAVYYQVVLTNVTVTSYQLTLGGGDGQPTEEVGIGYGAIKVTYTETDKRGKATGNVEFRFNTATNK